MTDADAQADAALLSWQAKRIEELEELVDANEARIDAMEARLSRGSLNWRRLGLLVAGLYIPVLGIAWITGRIP